MDINVLKESEKIIYVVGIGPGERDQMTIKADRVLSSCELIIGYTSYVDLIRDYYPDKEFLSTPMRSETERCRMAFKEVAAGKKTALICSGDPGVYALASLMIEIGAEYPDIKIEVVPGVTAALSGAALLGAPLSHDFVLISLSDYLTPASLIEERLRAAAKADLCICLYNPASKHRPDNLRWACNIILEYRSPDTICAMVKNIGRPGEFAAISLLSDMRYAAADMQTTVFIGNSGTYIVNGRMVTPRGYTF